MQPGHRVMLTFDAIEVVELTGAVVRVKPIGEEKSGDAT
jgi:hypothetical protein